MSGLSTLRVQIDLLPRLSTPGRLRWAVTELLRPCGIEQFLFGVDISPSLTRAEFWTLHNLEQAPPVHADDPLLHWLRLHLLPLHWSTLGDWLPPEQQPLLPDWIRRGTGASIPLRQAQGGLAWLHVAGAALDPEQLPVLLPTLLQLGVTLIACQQTLAPSDPGVPPLNPRELECLLWFAEGDSTAEVARRLHISERTTTYHLARACRKLGARNRQHALARALRLGLLYPRQMDAGEEPPTREPARSPR